MKARKAVSYGTARKVTSAAAAEKRYAVPEGCKSFSGIARKRWNLLTQAKDTWTDSELTQLYEAILAWADFDVAKEESERSPVMIEKSNGDIVAHPIHHEVRQRQRRLQDWLRAVGLNTSPDRAAASRGASALPEKGDTSVPGVKSNISLIG